MDGVILYQTNPNQATGGKGCLAAAHSRDCKGPFIALNGRVFSTTSPIPTVCAYHAVELVEKALALDPQKAVGQNGAIPDDPRIRRTNTPVAQPESPVGPAEEIIEQVVEAKKPRRRRVRKDVDHEDLVI